MTTLDEAIAARVAEFLAESPELTDDQREAAVRILSRPAGRRDVRQERRGAKSGAAA